MIDISSITGSRGRMLPAFVLLFCLLLPGCDRQEGGGPPGRSEPEPEYQGTIIAVGDSLTAGLGIAEEDAWPALLARKLEGEGYNWQVVNAGISGETSSGALGRIKWIAAQQPDVVILETGANDGLRGIPPSVIKENIGRAVQQLKEADITVVLAGMQMVQNLGPDYTREFAEIYPAVAGEQGVIFIPFLLQGVAGEPALNQSDTIHPNEDGHKIIAETIYPYVLQAITARGKSN
ncbi:MAG: arylesterase [Desulfobulbaceae bacterium]|jgi:acyl-CoA thioesterase-1|nr:arylesterase [Desulfobulbaceae bacterium]